MYPMQKSASGKGYGGYYPNGLRINPVLNVPTPCVSKGSANLFSLGSFLRVDHGSSAMQIKGLQLADITMGIHL
ncbi:hypothetical protein ACSQ67_009353 [Phaseolus vulgaris]